MEIFDTATTVKRYKALLYYLLVSGIRSGLIFIGIVGSATPSVLLLGFAIKLGLFPFSG